MGPPKTKYERPMRSQIGRSNLRKVVLPVKSRSFRPIKDSGKDSSDSEPEERGGNIAFHKTEQYKRLAHEGGPLDMGRKLRNMLKLPKAYKWAVYEWFYSSIDRVLLKEENDFQICLRESFPDLKTRIMTRYEWRFIRKLLGKPRRCSQTFLQEERRALHKKRAKIRWLQLRRPADPVNFRDIPPRIPKAFAIGDKVTAYLYQSNEVQSGLYKGTIEAIDVATNLYRVSFPRLGIGSFWISDAEVWCPEKYHLYPLESFMDAKRQITLNKETSIPSDVTKAEPGAVIITGTDQGLGDDKPEASKVVESNAVFGGFPIKFLGIMVHLTKLLTRKKYLIDKLCCENSRAEETRARSLPFTLDFQEKYAALLLELEVINKDLQPHFECAKQFAKDISGTLDTVSPFAFEIKEKCDKNAEKLVKNLQSCTLPQTSTDLITKLTSVMLQLKSMAEGEMRAFETKPLHDTLANIRNSVKLSNHSVFQRDVEVNVGHIQSSIKLFGSLHAINSS